VALAAYETIDRPEECRCASNEVPRSGALPACTSGAAVLALASSCRLSLAQTPGVLRAPLALAAAVVVLLVASTGADASTLTIVSRADGPNGALASSAVPDAVSDDGRYVAFRSYDHNLAGPPRSYASADLYLRDTVLGKTELLNREDGPAGAPIGSADVNSYCSAFSGLSADGRYVAISCIGRYGPGIFFLNRMLIRDRATGGTLELQVLPYQASITDLSGDGRYLLLAGGDQTTSYMHVRVDLTNMSYVPVSRYSGAAGAIVPPVGGHLSRNGRYAAFASPYQDVDQSLTTNTGSPTGPERVYLRDIDANTTTLVSRADGPNGALPDDLSLPAAVADSGRAFFATSASNLVSSIVTPAFPSLYARDQAAGLTQIVNRADGGGPVDRVPYVSEPAFSANGRYAMFSAWYVPICATLSPEKQLVFRDLTSQRTRTLVTSDGSAPSGRAGQVAMSADGRFAAFSTTATNLDPPQSSGEEVYLLAALPDLFAVAQPDCPAPVGPPSLPPPVSAQYPPPPGSASASPLAMTVQAPVRTRLRRSLRLRAGCGSVPCTITLSGRLSWRRRGSRSRQTFRIATERVQLQGLGPRTLTLVLPRRAYRAARHARRRGRNVTLRLTLRAQAQDATTSRSVSVRLV
jgi:hypothetical protein